MRWIVERGSGSRSSVEALVLHDGSSGSETVVLPFSKEGIRSFGPVDEARAFALANNGEIVLLSFATGAILARARSDQGFANALVMAGGDRLLIYKRYAIETWSTAPLQRIHSFNAIRVEGGKRRLAHRGEPGTFNPSDFETLAIHETVAPREVGKYLLFSLATSTFGASTYEELVAQQHNGFHRIDCEDWSCETVVVQEGSGANHLQAFSPSGRLALRSDHASLPLAIGARIAGAVGDADLPASHPDLLADGAERYGITLEQWRLDGAPAIERRPVVRMLQAGEVRSKPASRLTASAEQLRMIKPHLDRQSGSKPPTQSRAHALPGKYTQSLRALHETVEKIFWEPDEAGYWVLFRDTRLRRIGVNGEVSQLLGFTRWSGPGGSGKKVATRGGGLVEMRLPDPDLVFLADGTMRFGNRAFGHVHFDPGILDGASRPVFVEEDEDRFEGGSDWTKAVDKAVRERTYVHVRIAAADAPGRVAALEQLADILATGVEPLIWRDQLRVDFTQGRKRLKEAEFFDALIVDRLSEAVPALRRVLRTYLDGIKGGEGSQPWFDGDEGMAAFALALRALVMLDPDAFDIWRMYMLKRDGEHEVYSGRALYQEHLARFGWRGEEGLAFGVFVTLNLLGGGHGTNWEATGVIGGARSLVTSDRFAEMVTAEAESLQRHMALPDEAVGNWLGVLLRDVDGRDSWGEALATKLRAYLDLKCPAAIDTGA